MNEKIKIYLETSVISHLVAPDAKENERITRKLLNLLSKEPSCSLFISSFVIHEIMQCRQPKLSLLFDFLTEIEYNIIRESDIIYNLGTKYIMNGAFTSKQLIDAWHVASATAVGCDMLISWDLRHIVRLKTFLKVNAVNLANGYKVLFIATPKTLLSEYYEE